MKKDKAIHIRLTWPEYKRLKLEALERNMTVTALVRQAIKLYIETYTD